MRRASAWNELAKGAFRRVIWWCAIHLRHLHAFHRETPLSARCSAEATLTEATSPVKLQTGWLPHS